jgi:peptidoglycan/LPS O-acetylase OafA/YrhL
LYFVTGLGHEAVMVFFVLSGFLVGGSVLKASFKFSWRTYLVARMSRLYVVLIPALLVVFVCDSAGSRLSGAQFWYDSVLPHFNSAPFSASISAKIFLGNLLFLQTILVPPFGSDGPLWSLANEFWYYLIFPLFFCATLPIFRTWVRYLQISSAILFLLALPSGISRGFLVWLFGVLIHFLPSPNSTTRLLCILCRTTSAALMVATLVFAKTGRISPAFIDTAVGASFCIWLYAMVKIRNRGASGEEPPKTTALLAGTFSNCSYSLYTVHFPLLLLFRSAFGGEMWVPTANREIIALAILTCVFAFALGFSRLTEAHTNSVRSWINRHIQRPVHPSAEALRIQRGTAA